MKSKDIDACKKLIDRCKVVSFDVFDTLITRNLFKPSDLFDIVERQYNCKYDKKIKNYTQKRKMAEIKARSNTLNDDVTIAEIYDNLEISNDLKDILKNIEIETEISLCEVNKNFIEVYNYAKNTKKRILIVSDMYLPSEVISKILIKNNIIYDKLYVSSKYLKTKKSGNLYKILLHEEKIKPNQIIHFGDNVKSDFLRPKLLGIKTYRVKNNKDNLRHYNKNNHMVGNDKLIYEYINNFINNNIELDKDYFWKVGYEVFGPLLLGYTKWLKHQFELNNISKIYFLSRDGKIMKEAYDLIDNTKNTEYIYASRRSLLVPIIWTYDDLNLLLNEIIIPEHTEIKVSSLIKKFGLEPEKYENIIKKYDLNLNSYLCKEDILSNGLCFYEEIKNDVLNNSKKEFKFMQNYYKHLNFKGKVAIVDIGWYGLMQKSIERLCEKGVLDANINGYYVGIIPHSPNQDIYSMNGYLFSKKDSKLYFYEKFFNAIFEIVFSTNHGSVKKYSDSKNMVDFCDYEYKNTNTWDKINSFQKGALNFISQFSKTNVYNLYDFSNTVAFYNFMQFGNFPTFEDIREFGELDFYDYELVKINSSKSIFYYIIHPKKFIKDFKRAIWKVAFLKSVFKLNINYFKLVIKIRKIYKKS